MILTENALSEMTGCFLSYSNNKKWKWKKWLECLSCISIFISYLCPR